VHGPRSELSGMTVAFLSGRGGRVELAAAWRYT
jgi:hypothetical protein